jgi:translation elongation factor EF-Tu-like GTPase
MNGYAEVLVQFLPADHGGRHTPICLAEDAPSHYLPHLRVASGDGTYLGVEFVDGPEKPIPPGGQTYATVKFLHEPQVSYEDLSEGAKFDICEGGRVVGTGRVIRR